MRNPGSIAFRVNDYGTGQVVTIISSKTTWYGAVKYLVKTSIGSLFIVCEDELWDMTEDMA